MELLTAVNRILPKLGEHPVTSLNTKHPTLAILIPQIETKIEDVLTPGWWFNTSNVTLYPDSEGGIALPDTILSFIADKHPAVARGLKLYNQGYRTFSWSEAVTGVLIEKLPFDELPESVAQVVLYSALVSSYVTDIGMEDDVRMWQAEAQDAERRMNSEHLKNMRYSLKNGRRFQKIERARRY